jgi:hypothetical protein
MAIATIKYDVNNRPKRARYRIIILGNLDYHTCYFCTGYVQVKTLTTNIFGYIDHKKVLKNCDAKQVFIQSQLSENEEYYLRPPPGCARLKPGQYWHLLQSLYGSQRAPKLWFEMLCSHLKAMCQKIPKPVHVSSRVN